MNLQKHVVIINGVDKTHQVESIRLDGYRYAIKFNNSDKVYFYSDDKIVWLTNPLSVNINNCKIFIKGKHENNVTAVFLMIQNFMP